MRMVPTNQLSIKNPRGTQTRSKRKSTSRVAHMSAPLKGLSRLAQLNEADPLLASILTNFVVEQDRISLRPGYFRMGAIADGRPISTLIPFYGPNPTFIAAAGDGLFNAGGTRIGTHSYGSDQWQWTSFADLSQKKYTIMVNGIDGPIAWDGTNTSFPALATVDMSGHPDGFTGLPDADPAGFRQLDISTNTLPPGFDAAKLDKVLVHQNRLWFANSIDLAVYYLPLQIHTGTTYSILPLNAYFRRGGAIRAIMTWTYTGGAGMDDLLVIFSTNGEAAIYSGSNPDATDGSFKLVGIYRFDTPMAPGCTVNYGGELYVMIGTGLVPMSTLLKAEEDNLGASDQNIMQEFSDVSKTFRDAYGWSVIINSQTNHAICNMPIGSGKYQQLVRFMPNPIWSKWTNIPSRCWAWLDNRAYFGSENGVIYRGGRDYLNDDGNAIDIDVRFAWSSFKSVAKKQFKMIRLYMMSDSIPDPFVDVEVDYETIVPTNRPDPAAVNTAALWDTATWDVDGWAMDAVPRQKWQGVVGLGRVGAPRIRASFKGSTFALTGADVIFEEGGLM
jgi:hypothetical protein